MPWGRGRYPAYVSVAKRRSRAAKFARQLRKRGRVLSPVSAPRNGLLARNFWGQAWNDNLEAHADLAYRLERGRSYLRHGCVIDLQVTQGEVTAAVAGTELYTVRLTLEPLEARAWAALKRRCAGQVSSLVALLEGRLPEALLAEVTRTGGLLPRPGDLAMSCTCPDVARLCKHIAATLYGLGARLDDAPDELFRLRGVDQRELVTSVAIPAPAAESDLGDADLGALFGITLDETVPAPALRASPARAPEAQAEPEVAPGAILSAEQLAELKVSHKLQQIWADAGIITERDEDFELSQRAVWMIEALNR